MNNDFSNLKSATVENNPVTTAVAAYEAPAIESVVTFENLQREVLYAGTPATVPGTPNPSNP